MVQAMVRRDEDKFILEISAQDGESIGLTEGAEVVVDVRPDTSTEGLDGVWREAYEIELARGREALKYLAEH